jgi:glycosyltransferase involved in cell wall biosynthesis
VPGGSGQGGEIGEDEKDEFLGNAYALVFPIDWPEPFGLVMTEAMACGTPVIAFPGGSVPEVIEDGVNGFICKRIDEAVAAVERVQTLNRRRCREVFEERFSATRMAKDYAATYQRISVAAALDQKGPTTLLDLAKPTTEWMQAPMPQ